MRVKYPCEYPDWRRVDKHEKRIERGCRLREADRSKKKSNFPWMASWVDAEAATGSVPFRLHARTSSQAVLFRPCNAGDRFERSRKRAPFPAGITNLVTRRPPLPVTLHGRMVPFLQKKKKGGLILAEESIVGREKNIKFSR